MSSHTGTTTRMTHVGVPPGGTKSEGRVASLGLEEGTLRPGSAAIQSGRHQRVAEPVHGEAWTNRWMDVEIDKREKSKEM